ncbi:hypothetical protein VNO77_27724 [Canavalia gladiata]|uniref:Uncharacterized protein n=1 Tax=Canavalia gladiata TaxID=3824 RepID=A0AAN9QAS2_CANGL
MLATTTLSCAIIWPCPKNLLILFTRSQLQPCMTLAAIEGVVGISSSYESFSRIWRNLFSQHSRSLEFLLCMGVNYERSFRKEEHSRQNILEGGYSCCTHLSWKPGNFFEAQSNVIGIGSEARLPHCPIEVETNSTRGETSGYVTFIAEFQREIPCATDAFGLKISEESEPRTQNLRQGNLNNSSA